MCKCTPNIRTPFCGKPGCEPPPQAVPGESVSKSIRVAFETWAARHYDFDDADFKRDTPDRTYRSVTLRIAWQAWLGTARLGAAWQRNATQDKVFSNTQGDA